MRKAPVSMLLLCMLLGVTACKTETSSSQVTLQASRPEAANQAQIEETAQPKEEKDPGEYSVFTNCSKEEVEEFAQEVKDEILKKDWKSLAKKISYPLVFEVGENDKVTLQDDKFYEAFDLGEALSDAFMEAIKRESCTDMFANYQGCMLGDGQIWIAELLDENSKSLGLKIIAINN